MSMTMKKKGWRSKMKEMEKRRLTQLLQIVLLALTIMFVSVYVGDFMLVKRGEVYDLGYGKGWDASFESFGYRTGLHDLYCDETCVKGGFDSGEWQSHSRFECICYIEDEFRDSLIGLKGEYFEMREDMYFEWLKNRVMNLEGDK